MSHIWVTEIKEKGEWLPTTNCGLSKEDGRNAIRYMKQVLMNDKFRLRKYIREGGK